MERHVEWFESLQNKGTRIYSPIPPILHIDPIVNSYTTGGDEGHLYIVRVPGRSVMIKVGSTTQLIIRMYYYPKGTELLYCIKVDSKLRELEKKWIKVLKTDSRFRLAHGREWFYGTRDNAIDVLNDVIKGNYDDIIEIDDIIAGLIDDAVSHKSTNTCVSDPLRIGRQQLFYGIVTGKRKSIRRSTIEKYGLQIQNGILTIPDGYRSYIENGDTIRLKIK